MPSKSKQDAVSQIAKAMGVPDRKCATGSTEPKGIFTDVIEGLGLPIDTALSKPELGEAIAQAAGVTWDATCDSRNTPSGGGHTVTQVGLDRVLEAVKILKAQKGA